MKIKKLLSGALLLFCINSFSQVGIGTTTPTKELDVNGNTRIRGLSNSVGKTVLVSVQPDGTLVTNLTDNNAPGIKFAGFLNADLALNTDETFKEIILGNELIDVSNEYNATTGRYVPLVNGFYKVSLDFDIGGYNNSTRDIDVTVGLWDFTNNIWVMKRSFKHKNNNNAAMPGARNESQGIVNFLQLAQGNQYGFRVFTDYDNTVTTRTALITFQNSGSTGTSLSTSFSIEKML